MPMKATTATARAIVDLVTKCGTLIAEEKDPVVQREALASLCRCTCCHSPKPSGKPCSRTS